MRSVLIVDDDPDLQRIYSEKLRSAGFESKISTNSEQANEFINNSHPNLILLDIMIPGQMNGLEFLSQIKKNSKLSNIPVIVLTNLDNQKEDALKSGADAYFFKPNLSLNILIEKVKELAK